MGWSQMFDTIFASILADVFLAGAVGIIAGLITWRVTRMVEMRILRERQRKINEKVLPKLAINLAESVQAHNIAKKKYEEFVPKYQALEKIIKDSKWTDAEKMISSQCLRNYAELLWLKADSTYAILEERAVLLMLLSIIDPSQNPEDLEDVQSFNPEFGIDGGPIISEEE